MLTKEARRTLQCMNATRALQIALKDYIDFHKAACARNDRSPAQEEIINSTSNSRRRKQN